MSSKRQPGLIVLRFAAVVLAAILAGTAAWASPGAKAPPVLAARLAVGHPQDVIVLFDDSTIQAEAATQRARAGLARDSRKILAFKTQRFKALKQRVFVNLPAGQFEVLHDYDHLPLTFLRLRSVAALDRLVADPAVKAVYENRPKYPALNAESLNLINQPPVASAGEQGAGTTVAVLDTGVDYTRPDFGGCTAPGVPAGCKVDYYQNIADSSTSLDSNGHGTNVSGIVVGVAPESRVAMINVFGSGSSTSDALILQGIDWAIANQAAYNIVALNMSLSDGIDYTAPCSSSATNPFVSAVANALSAGIVPVAAAGNSGFTNGISNPACTPGVVSVGAVYDANLGQVQYASCTDTTSAPDKITCFSNSAYFLTLFAPGAIITAGGYTMAGTSQASPHIAGAIAVLRSTFPDQSPNETVAQITGAGPPLVDPRNGVTVPRLDLLAAARPPNDAFVHAATLAGSSGQAVDVNLLATKEPGEPNHAGNPGGASVWWNWTAPASGQVSLDTHGSGFDTLLAVYTGTTVGTLQGVAANDNDGTAGKVSGLLFEAQSGTTYRIAVDGYNGAAGPIALNWYLNDAAQADLSVTATSTPALVLVGYDLTYTLTVVNAGPQSATNVKISAALPPNVAYLSATPGCADSSNTVTCDLGTLGNGAVSTIQIVARVSAPGPTNGPVTASSDLPDPTPADNAAAAGGSSGYVYADEDIPFVPGWAQFSLAISLLVAGFRALETCHKVPACSRHDR